MLAKRIIPCLDVKDGQVVKGIQFINHQVVGDIETLAKRYRDEGADELVFYDITASCSDRVVDTRWVTRVARLIDIPFCVAGGIRTLEKASAILHAGADKISINSPALENPALIDQMVAEFGSQCIVIGIDSRFENGEYSVYQYTGSEDKIKTSKRRTQDWATEVCDRGCGEIVLNCMNRDGEKNGFDTTQLSMIKALVNVPIIASGGAGSKEHFQEVFSESNVDGALAASIFHSGSLNISDLKNYLAEQAIEVRR